MVSIFELSVVLGVFLDSIVGQVNSVVLAVVEYVLKGCSSEVAFFAEKDFHVLIDQNPHSDVKLSTVDQIRPLNVFLNDETHVFVNLKRCRKLIQIVLQLGLCSYGTEQRLF